MPENMLIRSARIEDAAALLEIYRPYADKTAVSFEYGAPSREEFAARVEKTLERYPYLVAENGGRLLGYAYAGAYKSRPAYGWAAETTVYMAQDMKRRGVGGLLYRELEAELREQGVQTMYACIACTDDADEYLNRDSLEFHARMGFSEVGRFHKCGYKFGRWYDTVWMEKFIGDNAVPPPPFRPRTEVRP